MTDALLWNEIGNLYLQSGSHNEAISAIKRAIEMDPDSAWFHCNLGHAYFQAGEYGNALSLYRMSIQLMKSPQDQAVVWNKVGDTCRALKDLESAMRAYRKADELNIGIPLPAQDVDTHPGNSAHFLETIREKIDPDTNNLLSGLKRLVSHVERSFSNPVQAEGGQRSPAEPEQVSVDADTRPSRAVRANKAIEQGLPSMPAENPQEHAEPSVEAVLSPMPEKKSIFVFPDPNEVSTQSPDGNQPGNDDGYAEETSHTMPNLANLEEILAKVHIYENITQTNPSNDRAWDTLGKLYKSLGRFKDAIAAYKKAIEKAPQREVYYYYLGLLYSVEQQHDDAVEAFLLVLQKNPDYVLAHGALAGVYHRMGQENKANHHISIALPMMNNESAYNRACFYAICGDAESALKFLEVALRDKDTTIDWVKSDPDLDPIRKDSRYLDLVASLEKTETDISNGNYFSCELDGAENRLLPLLNNSLAR